VGQHGVLCEAKSGEEPAPSHGGEYDRYGMKELRQRHPIYTVFHKKTGPFVISSYLCFEGYELQENYQKYIGGVACCGLINYSLLI